MSTYTSILTGSLGTHLYQCTSWHCCERLHLASVNFFEDPFTMFAHFMMGDLQAHLLQPPYLSSLSPSDFSKFPWSKKVRKGKHFANVEEVKQKWQKH